MQPCKTGDQPYSDASPNGECTLTKHIINLGMEDASFRDIGIEDNFFRDKGMENPY